MTTSRPKVREGQFLGLPLNDPGADGLIRWLVAPNPAVVAPAAAAYLNAHTVNLALRVDGRMGELWKQMDLVYPDGMSVVRAARRHGYDVSGRVSAGDFFHRFLWAASAQRRSLALIGGPDGLARQCGESLGRSIRGLRISFSHHGFFAEDSREERKMIGGLRAAAPDVVLLGMGSPRQERLALRLRNEGAAPTIWCVGALFEYFTPGQRRHAPLWMRSTGLEWAFRLSQEPIRLGRRYLVGNLEFLLRERGWIH